MVHAAFFDPEPFLIPDRPHVTLPAPFPTETVLAIPPQTGGGGHPLKGPYCKKEAPVSEGQSCHAENKAHLNSLGSIGAICCPYAGECGLPGPVVCIAGGVPPAARISPHGSTLRDPIVIGPPAMHPVLPAGRDPAILPRALLPHSGGSHCPHGLPDSWRLPEDRRDSSIILCMLCGITPAGPSTLAPATHDPSSPWRGSVVMSCRRCQPNGNEAGC
jgi:hypothetical protein